MIYKNFLVKHILLPEQFSSRLRLHLWISVSILCIQFLMALMEFITGEIPFEELFFSFVSPLSEALFYLLTIACAEKVYSLKTNSIVYVVLIKWTFIWALSFTIMFLTFNLIVFNFEGFDELISIILNNIIPYIIVSNIVLFMFTLKESKEEDIYLFFKHSSQESRVLANHIIYVKSEGNYLTIIYLEKDKVSSLLTRMTLNDFKSDLVEKKTLFLQSHRSYVVNPKYIQSIIKVDGKNMLSFMNCDKHVPISSSNYSEIMKHFKP